MSYNSFGRPGKTKKVTALVMATVMAAGLFAYMPYMAAADEQEPPEAGDIAAGNGFEEPPDDSDGNGPANNDGQSPQDSDGGTAAGNSEEILAETYEWPVMGDIKISDEQLNEAREDFFEAASEDGEGLEVIEADLSYIIHVPQEYPEPEPPPLFEPFAAQEPAYSGPFYIGDTRDFRASTGSSSSQDKIVRGVLAGQGLNVNIWVLDDADYHIKTGTVHNSSCHLTDITSAVAQNIANDFDAIYGIMTEDFGAHSDVRIFPGYSNVPEIGDLGNDGKINFLLYDIFGDGGGSGGYTAGFFSSGDFFTFQNDGLNLRPEGWVPPVGMPPAGSFMNCLDLMHIDIGANQGYRAFAPGADLSDKLGVYSTLAHEFQHMLFYMHIGMYAPSDISFSWFNEALSELAGTFYVQEGGEIAEMGRISSAARNSYLNGSAYGDMLNFNNSMKNYGMGKLFSMLLYKKYGSGYVRGVYDYIAAEFPPAQNSTGRTNNSNKISALGHNGTVGNLLHNATGIGTGADAFPLIYYLFMENFAADGGMIAGETPVQTTKFYTAANPVDNLWAYRPVGGIAGGRVYALPDTSFGSYYNVSAASNLIPTYNSGDAIALSGYGTPNVNPASQASHEMLYKLGGGGEAPILNITAPDDGNDAARYYAVVPKDRVVDAGTFMYTNGTSGADVYPLEKGAPAVINTNGYGAYLFVSTLNRNVNSTVTFSWGAAGANDLIGTVTLSSYTPRVGQAITASVTPPGAYAYSWTSDGAPVGANSSSYTTVAGDFGKIIRVAVTQDGKTGALTAQTVAVAKNAAPPAPPIPAAAEVTAKRITLQAVAGCEYSAGGIVWRDSPVFGSLLPETEYVFYQRVKETATQDASPMSPPLTVSTLEVIEIQITGADIEPKTYDATAELPAANVISVSFENVKTGNAEPVPGEAYEVINTAYTGNVNAGTGRPVTFAVRLLGTATLNYELRQTVFTQATAGIVPADYSLDIEPSQTFREGKGLEAITVGIDGITAGSGVEGEEVSGSLTWYSDDERLNRAEDNDLKLMAGDEKKTLYWSFAATNPNYTDTPKTGQTEFTAQAVLYGDANGDKRVNGTDVQALILWINSGYTVGNIDVETANVTGNPDGPDCFDVLEIVLWINAGGRPLEGMPRPKT